MTDVIDELKRWLDTNWDPDMTVGEWWERLGMAGWSAPSLPAESYGRGASRNDAVRVAETIAAHGALAAPGGLGLLLACTFLLGPVSIYSFAVVFFIHTTLNITVHSGLTSKRLLLWPIDMLTHKHYVHHAGSYDNNYASLTPFWDVLFGTRG